MKPVDIKEGIAFSAGYEAYSLEKIEGFEIMKIISVNNKQFILKLIKKENGINYIAKLSYKSSEFFFKSQIINYSRQINILLRLHHPCIQRIIEHQKLPNPVIITDFASNGTLNNMIKAERNNQQIEDWNDTAKLIIIYGIASGMSYLHSHGIIHRDLKPKNIVLDDRLFPKITGFDISKKINSQKSKKLKGTPIYLSPEVYNNKEYSKASDVYAFSLLVYEIMTNDKPFKKLNNPYEIMKEVKEKGERPIFNKLIPNCYRKLIEKCWSQNPNERPTFDEIIDLLKNDKEFITEKVNEDKYLNYIKFIEKSEISFDSSRKDLELNEIFCLTKNKEKIEDFEDFKYNLCFGGVFKTEINNISIHSKYINREDYKIVSTFFWDNKNFYNLQSKEFADQIYSVKDFDKGFSFLSFQESVGISLNANISSKLNHPAIREFIGLYWVKKKDDIQFPCVANQRFNSTLFNILELIKDGKEVKEWNDTKKLINIFGIASALSYLHSNNIIHNNLNIKNIYLNEYLFPLIDDFSKSIELENEEFKNIKNSNYYELQGNVAPETREYYNISKSSDVFAFAHIMYQIMANYILDNRYYYIHARIFKPRFFFPIPDCYRNLIEKCWADNPDDRPTFDEIVAILKTDKNFITDSVDEKQYLSYIEYIEKSKTTFNLNELKNIKNATLAAFNKSYISYSICDEENINRHLNLNLEEINLDNYECISKIGEGAFGKVYKIIDKKADNIYVAKKIKNISLFDDDTIINIEREITNISKANFPSILKFYGYCSHDFKMKNKPTIITEYAFNGSLDKIIELERSFCSYHGWNDTKKLINIYGIAAGMDYLHSIGIIHRDLKPANIFLDDNFYPKIGDFGLSKEISPNPKNNSGFKGTPLYCAPEIFKEYEYSFASDVFAFSIIMYEIVTNLDPYNDDENRDFRFNPHLFPFKVDSGCRPKFLFEIPNCYRSLIEKCWSKEPEERLTFKEIVNILETNSEFITNNVDREEYLDYIELLKGNQKTESKAIVQSNHININESKLEEDKLSPKTIDLNISKTFSNLKEYKMDELISKGSLFKVYKIENIKTKTVYAAKISSMKIVEFDKNDMINISREIKILSQVNYPSILKFIGYSCVNFKNKPKPVIITEFASNLSIDKILKLERKGQSFTGWDDTKKLINIFGIASGMKYLHSKNILHRDLKPSNVLLDDYLFPKIGDFGLSIQLHNKTSITFQSDVGSKGTAAYIAPEIYINDDYSKKVTCLLLLF